MNQRIYFRLLAVVDVDLLIVILLSVHLLLNTFLKSRILFLLIDDKSLVFVFISRNGVCFWICGHHSYSRRFVLCYQPAKKDLR